jgi:hypothetical protein
MMWQAGGELHAIGERLLDQQVGVLRLAGEERIASQVRFDLTLARITRERESCSSRFRFDHCMKKCECLMMMHTEFQAWSALEVEGGAPLEPVYSAYCKQMLLNRTARGDPSMVHSRRYLKVDDTPVVNEDSVDE